VLLSVRRLEDRVRNLQTLLGRETLEVEILRGALDRFESKKSTWRLPSPSKDGFR